MRKSQYVMAFPVKDKYLLIHGLSGAVHLVSKETAKDLFDENVTEELKPFFTHLTPEEEREQARSLCAFLMKRARTCADSTIVITYDCNLQCPYCYEIWVKNAQAMSAVISTSMVDKAFEAMETLNRECTGKKPLVLTGGESLMKKNRDTVRHILKRGSDLGYTFTVFTNGVELHHFLSDLSSVPLDYLQITLDGPRHLHDRRRVSRGGGGTFDVIVKNIEEARKRGLPLLIRTNADPEILSHLEELAAFFRERGWVGDPHMTFSLAIACEQTADPEVIAKKLELYRKTMDVVKNPELRFFEAYPFRKLLSIGSEHPRFWPAFWHCNAVTKRHVFDPYGDVYPCRGVLGWKEQRIGRYLPELRFNETHEKWQNRTVFTLEGCADCEIALVCGGGCGYASLLGGGDLNTPVCSSGERAIQDYVKYLYERGQLR